MGRWLKVEKEQLREYNGYRGGGQKRNIMNSKLITDKYE